jgi:hypothetical protein
LVNRQHLLFTETWRHSKFGSNLCKIHGEKHPRAFVKVVEASEIYNFSIHHVMHFYSNFWSFKRSNMRTLKRFRVGRHRAPPTRRPRTRATAALGICAARLPRPRAPSPGRSAPLDASEFPHSASRRTGRSPRGTDRSVHCFHPSVRLPR